MGLTDEILEKHEEYRNRTINLIPSENLMSHAARRAMSSDMGHRYFFKESYKTSSGVSYEYHGTKYIEKMYDLCIELAKKLFKADYAEVFPISGHMSNLSILTAFAQPADSIMVTDPENGGYPGLAREKLPRHLGLSVEYIPTAPEGEIDIDGVRKRIEQNRIKIMFLTYSWTLFPVPLGEISEICRGSDCVLVYDASHTLGLIAGGKFQDPLMEGADYMVGSTHKTFPGPQGGIILGNKENKKISEAGHFVTADNIHFHRIAALARTMEEMLEYGEDYARQTVRNAKTLAEALYNRGFPVLFADKGFTESHQIKMDINRFDGFKSYGEFTSISENAGLIMDNSGRLGVSEITRLGMREKEMEEIANLMQDIYVKKDIAEIRKKVFTMRENFKTVNYC